MKFTAISDIHVKIAGDNAEDLLLEFIKNIEVK